MDQPPYCNQHAIAALYKSNMETVTPIARYGETMAIQLDTCRAAAPSGNMSLQTEASGIYPPGHRVMVEASEYDRLLKSVEESRTALHDRERELEELRANFSALQGSHGRTLKALEDHIANLETNRIIFENDNQTLRAYVSNMKAAQTQLRTDLYYIDRLQGLNRQIQDWVANNFIEIPKKQRLTEQAGAELLGMLSKIFPHGNKTSFLLKEKITKAHEEPDKRVALARHIFALYLWERVFSPLVFGLSQEESKIYRMIEENMIMNGKFQLHVAETNLENQISPNCW